MVAYKEPVYPDSEPIKIKEKQNHQKANQNMSKMSNKKEETKPQSLRSLSRRKERNNLLSRKTTKEDEGRIVQKPIFIAAPLINYNQSVSTRKRFWLKHILDKKQFINIQKRERKTLLCTTRKMSFIFTPTVSFLATVINILNSI